MIARSGGDSLRAFAVAAAKDARVAAALVDLLHLLTASQFYGGRRPARAGSRPRRSLAKRELHRRLLAGAAAAALAACSLASAASAAPSAAERAAGWRWESPASAINSIPVALERGWRGEVTVTVCTLVEGFRGLPPCSDYRPTVPGPAIRLDSWCAFLRALPMPPPSISPGAANQVAPPTFEGVCGT